MRSSRIPLLVLAHLGVGGAFASCASQGPVVEAEVIPIGSVTPTSTTTEGPFILGHEPGPVGSTLAPISSAASSAAASSRPSPSGMTSFRPPPRPVLSIGRPPPPSRPPPTPRGNVRVIKGRPLVVEGVTYVAPHAALGDDETAALVRAAHDEHASIAAFARTVCELMALGAPLALVHETQAALADEIRHTEMTLALLERAGRPLRIAALEAATLPLRRDVADFFRDVLRGGAVGETLAAADADERREHARDPELAAYYATIADDEARHAALAYKTLRWLLDAHPTLAATLTEERARLNADEHLLTAPLFDAIAP
ncbi:MAG: ferritin-like domain-containing protein [Labilithrix sp.]|nr:ferritin-like domain-containing protein [Labilithrix sp.]MCW5817126.1 ferritin-like domain-containing protein [Labilithrix sp.]